MRRRQVLAALAGLPAAALAGCGTTPMASDDQPRRWHDGRLSFAGGNTTGVFYVFGGGYADLLSKFLDGYEVHAEPTGGSGDNVKRIASGDMEIGLSFADVAADAVTGKAAFDGQPQRISTLARVYRNYAHLVVRNAANIAGVGDLRGKRVSTSTLNSGTDLLAGRLLTAAGLSPDADIVRRRLSLPETTKGMQTGEIDALFFSAGLPVPGVADLMAGGPGLYSILPMSDLLPAMINRYGAAYGVAKIPKAMYSTPADVETIVVPNFVIVSPDMPEQLAYDCTKILFEHQPELAKAHPDGNNFDKASGPQTTPVPLHPGARRYFDGG